MTPERGHSMICKFFTCISPVGHYHLSPGESTVTSETWWAIFFSNMTQMSSHSMVIQRRVINFWYNIPVSHHSQSPLWQQWTIKQQYMTSLRLRVVTHRCESNEPLSMMPVRLYVTINVPVAYMARDVMLLMRANLLQGPLEGGGAWKSSLFGPKKKDEKVHKLERERKERYEIGNWQRERLWKRRYK